MQRRLVYFGYKAYIITSNSMEPEINKGDVVIVKNNKELLQVNDIITFVDDGQVNTHRIIEIIEAEGHKEYKTKGDNNDIEDTKNVTDNDIIGKVTIKIPYLGSIILFMKDQIIILIIILIILVTCLYKMYKKDKSELRRRKKEIEDQKQ